MSDPVKIEYFYNETNKHIRNVQLLLNEVVRQLLLRARLHDVSKFSQIEKELFVEVIPEMGKCEYGSEKYKATLSKIKPAIEHHNLQNPHHPEHYPNGINGMSLIDLIEMICDWYASSQRNLNGDILKSIGLNQKRFGYSEELQRILVNTISCLSHTKGLLEPHCDANDNS